MPSVFPAGDTTARTMYSSGDASSRPAMSSYFLFFFSASKKAEGKSGPRVKVMDQAERHG